MTQRQRIGFSLCFTLLLSSSYKTVPHGIDTDKHLIENNVEIQQNTPVEDIDMPSPDSPYEQAEIVDKASLDSSNEQQIQAQIAAELDSLLSKMQIIVQQLGSGGRKLSSIKENKMLAQELSSQMMILKQIQETLANPEPLPSESIEQAAKFTIFIISQIQRLSKAHGIEALKKEIETNKKATKAFFHPQTRGSNGLDAEEPSASLAEHHTHLAKHIDSLIKQFDQLGRSYFNETMRDLSKKLNAWKVMTIAGVATGGLIFKKLSDFRTAYRQEERRPANMDEVLAGTASPQLSVPAQIGSYLETALLFTQLGFISEKLEAETGFSNGLNQLYRYCSNGMRTTFGKIADKLCGTYDENNTYGLYQDPMDRWKVYTTKTFEDVVGLDYVKEPLEKVISFINNPNAFSTRGLRPGNLMFTGKPRTGKSFIAECLAGEAAKRAEELDKKEKFNYYSLPASDIMAFGIKEFLKLAATKAPCVLVIDEFDMLGLQRTSNTALLADFLCGMSGCDQVNSDKPMIIIAITNNPENLDGALRQKGRFDQEIRFVEPTISDRLAFIARRTHSLGINLSQHELLQLAHETDGCVIEELEAMISHACVKSLLKKSYADFPALLDAFDYEVRRIMPSMPLTMTATEKNLIAVNHIGKALWHSLQKESQFVLSKVSILPRVTKVVEEHAFEQMGRPDAFKQSGIAYGDTYGYPLSASAGVLTTQDLINKCKEALAGFAAERVLCGSCAYGFNGYNKALALHYARQIAGAGIPESMCSDKQKEELYDRALGLLQQYEEELVQLFSKHQERLKLLTSLLVVLEEINGPFFQEVLNMNDEKAAELRERLPFAHKMRTQLGLGKGMVHSILLIPQEQFEAIKQEIDAEEKRYADTLQAAMASETA